MYQPALFFVGLTLAFGRVLQRLLLLMQFHLPLTFADAVLIFLVQQGRFLGGPTLLVQIGDFDFPAVLIFVYPDQIADFDVFARFAALAVDMHFPAIDGVGRQAAGFEKPRGPQPFIDTNFGDFSQEASHSPPRF